MFTWISLATFALIVSLIFLFLVLAYRRENQVTRMLKAWGIRVPRFRTSSLVKTEYNGQKLEISCTKGAKEVRIKLSTPCEGGPEWQLQRKSDLSVPVEFRSVSTGDRELDERYVLRGRDTQSLTSLFSDAELRRTIKEIPHSALLFLGLEAGRLELEAYFRPDSEKGESVPNLADWILKIKAKILSGHALEGGSVKRSRKLPFYLLCGIPIALMVTELVLAIVLGLRNEDGSELLSFTPLLLKTLFISLSFLVPYLYIAYRICMNYVRPHAKFAIALAIGAVWFMSSLPLAQEFNAYHDPSEVRIAHALILDKRAKDNTYLLHFDMSETPARTSTGMSQFSWLGRQGKYSIPVKSYEYFHTVPRQTKVKLFLKEGVLKVTWTKDYVLYYDGVKKDEAYDYHFMGFRRFKDGQFERAIQIYSKGIEITGGTPVLYYNRGVAYTKLGKLSDAKEDFEKAIAIKPDMIEAYKNLSRILVRSGSWGEIVELWSKFLRNAREHPDAYFERGLALRRVGKQEEALKDLRRACDLGKKEACRI